MILNSLVFLLICMCTEGAVAIETPNNDHHNLIERLQSIEEQQRGNSKRKSNKNRNLTVKSQAKIIKQQSRDLEGLEFIVQKHRTRVQQAYRMSRINRRRHLQIRKVLMNAGLIKNKKSEKTEENSQHVGDEQEIVRHQEGVDIKDERHETTHRLKSRITKKHFSSPRRAVPIRRESESVSFSVYIDHDVDLGVHQTIKFNQIITNERNGYNQHSGVFTCPDAGMYMFSFFIGQRGEAVPKGMVAELLINSKNVLDAIVDSHSPGQDITGGNVVIVRLNQGDVVWIDSLGNSGHAEGSTGLKLTSFSGVYLYP